MLLAALCIASAQGACGAWQGEAPVPYKAPPCPTVAERLPALRARLAAGGFTHLRDWLASAQVTSDLQALARARIPGHAPSPAPAAPPAHGSATASAPERTDGSAALTWLAAVIDTLLMPPPTAGAAVDAGAAQDPAQPSLDVLAAAAGCSDASTWRFIATILRDPRADDQLGALATAIMRPKAARASELAAAGLADTSAPLALLNSLLRSLADPTFDPAALLDVLSGLSSTPGGLLHSLSGTLRLLITEADGGTSQPRRAALTALLTCARSGDAVGALPWHVHGLLVRQPGVAAADLPPNGSSDWRASLEAAAVVADFFGQPGRQAATAGPVARRALTRLLVGGLQAPLLRELQALLRPPLSTELSELAVGLAEAATCAAP